MTELDWLIVAFAAVLAFFGFRQGFIVGALSFAGFVGGAFLGTRLGPLLLPQGSSSPYAPAFGLVGALLGGAILASGLEGVAFRLRRTLIVPGLGAADGALGALLGAVLALAIVWIVAAVAAQTPGAHQLRSDIQRSAILRELNGVLPPSGPILDALARLDPLPAITGPSPNVAPPSPGATRLPGVRTASRSVVRVLGTACGLAIEGSGWVAAPDIVVTNAHVVAGEGDTTIEPDGHAPRSAPNRSSSTPKRTSRSCACAASASRLWKSRGPRRRGRAGRSSASPRTGPSTPRRRASGAPRTSLTQNAYGQGPVTRLLTPLRGLVRPGNSGGPVVDGSGRVLTTVFASTVGARSRHGGYGVADATVAALLRRAANGSGAEVSTGPCTAG